MGEKYLGYAKPSHAVQLPREPGMVDLGNGTGIKNGVVTGPIPVNVCNYSQHWDGHYRTDSVYPSKDKEALSKGR